MSCDNLFIHISNDIRAAHTPCTQEQTITPFKNTGGSEQWVQHLLDKFTAPSVVFTNCLNLFVAYPCCFFCLDDHTPKWCCSNWSQRFQLPDVHSSPPQALFSFLGENEAIYTVRHPPEPRNNVTSAAQYIYVCSQYAMPMAHQTQRTWNSFSST